MISKLTIVLSTTILATVFSIFPVSLFGFQSTSNNRDVAASALFNDTSLISSKHRSMTLTSTQILTFTPTSTLTLTLSPSTTLTATLLHPSEQEISDALSEEFNEIKVFLQKIVQNTEPPNALIETSGNIASNVFSNFLWEYMFNPLVTILLTFIGSFSVVGKIALKIKDNRIASKGKVSSKTDKKLNSILDVIIIAYVVIFVLFLLNVLFITQGAVQIQSNNEITPIIERLDRIENLLQTQPDSDNSNSQVENYYSGRNLYIILALLLSVGANLLLLFIYGGRQKNYELTESSPMNIQVSDSTDKHILPAVLLALILLLLPYPVDTLLLPFIVQYFMLAFFDVVYLYQNQHLKRIVIRHFSLLILLAEFGVWFSFFEAFRRLFFSAWNSIQPLVQDTPYAELISGQLIFDFWEIAPFPLAVLLAIPGWFQLTRLARDKAIPKIIESVNGKKSDV